MANAMKADAAVDGRAGESRLLYNPVADRWPRQAFAMWMWATSLGPSSPPLVMVQRLDPIYTDFTIAEPDIPLVRQHLNGPTLQVLTEERE